MGVGLEGGHEPVGAEGNDAGAEEDQAAVFADALPDQSGSADLGHRGQGVQQDRAQHSHGLTLPRGQGLARVGRAAWSGVPRSTASTPAALVLMR
jgi:hypothetical protein